MITVIIPAFNEGECIYKNIAHIHSVIKENSIEHEFMIVDDGSRDNTWEELCRIKADIPNVNLIKLSRNFGKEAALCAGLENAEGDAVIVMDADLQHPPEYIPEMVRLYSEEGYDVVECVKKSRGNESLFQRLAAKAYYKIFNKATSLDIGAASDFKLLNRNALEGWLKFNENNTYFRGLSAWIGFKRCSIPIEIAERSGGTTKWTLKSLCRLAVTSIVSYTSAPLFFVLWLGIIMGIAALVLTVETLYMYFSHNAETGFSTVILLQLFTSSGIMISLSIIGLYIAKIYDEVKNRPRYIIKSKILSDSSALTDKE